MGRIREYFARNVDIDVSPLQRLASDQQQTGQMRGRAIRDTWNGIGQGVATASGVVQKHLEQDDASKITIGAAEAKAEMDAKWDEHLQNADPTDPELANNFLDTVVNPTLSKLGDNVNTPQGKRMYEEVAARIRADFFTKTTADQNSLRGSAAVNNLMTFRNKMSTALAKDPTGFGTSVALVDTVVSNYQRSFNVKPEMAMKLSQEMKHEFAISAIQAMAERNPGEARKALASGRFDEYIDGSDHASQLRYIDQQERAAEAELKAAGIEQKKAEREQADAEASRISASLIKEDGTVGVPENFFKDIITYSKLPGAEAGTVSALRNAGMAVLNREAKGLPVKTDAITVDDFRQRASLDQNDPRRLTLAEVFQARADGKLSDKDFAFYSRWVNAEVKDPAKRAAMTEFNKSANSLKGYITKSNMLRPDAVGDDRFREFSMNAQERFMKGLDDGKTVKELLDKASPDYVFADLPRYQLSKEQARDLMREQLRGNLTPQGPVAPPAAVPQRNQGESAADYLKRIRGQ